MILTDLKIGVRLNLGFALILALLFLVTALGVSRMAQIEDRLDDITQNNMVKLKQVSEMRSAIQLTAIAVRNLVLVTGAQEMAAETNTIEKQRQRYAMANKKLLAMAQGTAEKALITRMEEANTRIRPLLDKAIKLGQASMFADVTDVLLKEVAPSQQQWLQALDAMAVFEEKNTAITVTAANNAYASARLIMIALAITALVLGIGIAWFMSHSITRPLDDAIHLSKRISEGDLTQQVNAHTGDETGQLVQSMQTMQESLAAIVGQVRDGTDAISVASRQIASGNADLASRTEQQSSSLEETASSMEELTSTVKQNSENARQANQMVIATANIAVKGGNVVGQVVTTMASIKESSRKISDIIGVIDGIAFQTNILALNAAVEAARAGEQGRGFAVVAAEVRSLAQRSAGAAKEIKALIEDSVGKVDVGSQLVDEAGNTMNEIVTSVKRVTDLMSEIAAASQEQSSGIEQINQAITQMDDMTQQNAALVEQAAAAAESLEEQAQNLTRAVSVFRLANGSRLKAASQDKPVRLAPASRPRAIPVTRSNTLAAAGDGEWETF